MKTNQLEYCFADSRLSVRIHEREGQLWMETTDRLSGRSEVSRLLGLEIFDRALRREERIAQYQTDCLEAIDRGVRARVRSRSHGISAAVSVSVEEGELVIRARWSDMEESKPDRYLLFAIHALPEFGKVTGFDARLLLPVSGAAICHPAGKPAVEDRFAIYLEQPRWELISTLPIAGAWDQSGGWMWLASRCPAEAECRVATDGQDGGQVGFAFRFRHHRVDPVEAGLREFRCIPFSEKEDPVHFVARRLRRHVIEDLGKPTLAQRAEESPEVDYLLRSMTVKLFHGMRNEGAAIFDSLGNSSTHFIKTLTFSEAGECLRKLRDAGIPRLYTQSVGWNARGHDGWYPTRFPVEEALGGESGFRELLRLGDDLGYQMNVHDNFQMNVPDAPDWDPDCVIHDLYGDPLMRGWWAGGTEYASWPAALPVERLDAHLERVKALGVSGMYYCDYWIAPLELNYHPQWRGSRTAHLQGMSDVLGRVRRHFGSVGTEFGILGGLMECDSLPATFPQNRLGAAKRHTEWPVAALLDEFAPVYALAMHGLVAHCSKAITWESAAQCILWGGLPRDEWGIRPIKMHGIHLFSNERISWLKAAHELCVERFGFLAKTELARTATSQTGVTENSFADGTVIIWDAPAKTLLVNGEAVSAPANLPNES